MNMGWVYSINHQNSPSLIALELPRFLANFQKLASSSICKYVCMTNNIINVEHLH